MRLRALIIMLPLAFAGCNPFAPSRSVEGSWVGHQFKSSLVCLELRQDGDTITGTASAVTDGFLLYSRAPVNGEYPDVQFTVGAANTAPCCPHLAGARFDGRQDSSDDIVGRYGSADIRFEPGDASLCQRPAR
jgi:hypothetical protein